MRNENCKMRNVKCEWKVWNLLFGIFIRCFAEILKEVTEIHKRNNRRMICFLEFLFDLTKITATENCD